MSSLWRLRGCLPPLPRSQAAAAKLANLTSISSEGHHSFQPETSGYSVHVAMFTRSCLAEDDTLITQLFVKTSGRPINGHPFDAEMFYLRHVCTKHIWKSAQEDFTADMIVEKLLFQSYFKGVGIDWCFIAALKDLRQCSLVSVMVEVDRILRPQETFIVNDGMEKIGEIEKMMESLK
ncbi:hypothetical protein IGI04_024371 [Brassica rapa subsp. trilocularis]|uniref:MATH domain-containing protein n=1 Tax=Brassica rapa subsp. trilocularis TaxID=1813537 RepID=A0ABQ7M8J6_BRACM|nr:hypothetical protein IGI04_024371 [Brassica rapa subsp. trilocularis]